MKTSRASNWAELQSGYWSEEKLVICWNVPRWQSSRRRFDFKSPRSQNLIFTFIGVTLIAAYIADNWTTQHTWSAPEVTPRAIEPSEEVEEVSAGTEVDLRPQTVYSAVEWSVQPASYLWREAKPMYGVWPQTRILLGMYIILQMLYLVNRRRRMKTIPAAIPKVSAACPPTQPMDDHTTGDQPES
jgi:hypothetical protein